MYSGKRSRLFWGQKALTASVALVLACFTFRLAWLANLGIAIRGLTVTEPRDLVREQVTLTELANEHPEAGAPTGNASPGSGLPMDLVTVQVGTAVRARAALERERGEDVPEWFVDRTAWYMFGLDRSRYWVRRDCDASEGRLAGDTHDFIWRFTEPGRYVIVCSIPPASATGMEAVSTERLSRFLNGRFSQRCGVLAVAVPGDRREAPEMKPTPAPPAPSEPPPNENHASAAPAQSVQDGQLAEPEQANGNTATERDARTAQEGVETDDNFSGRENSTADTMENGPPGSATRIPPREGKELADLRELKKRMRGNLPELDLLYVPDDFHELSFEQWQEVVRRYEMPLVLTPDSRFAEQYAGIPILDPISGELRMADGSEVVRQYGRYPLRFDLLGPALRDSAVARVGDEIWARACDRFYLLGLATYMPVQACLKQEGSLEGVMRIRACLRVQSGAQRPWFTVSELEVVRSVREE